MRTIGIDVGGTAVKIISFDNKTLRSASLPTPRTRAAFSRGLTKLLNDFKADGVQGIGVAMAGRVSQATGKVISAHNLPFLNGFNFKTSLSRYSRRFALDNDVNCMAIAETAFGAARRKKDAFVLAIGTGIGGGIIIGGKLYRGMGSAGEIGHTVVESDKTLEDLAGGKTLRTFNAAELRRAGYHMGTACANVINLLNPEVIILAGGVIEHHYHQLLPHIRAAVKRHALWHAAAKTDIVPSNLGPYAAALGAAILVSNGKI